MTRSSWGRLRKNTYVGYAIAVLSVAVAVTVQLLLWPYIPPSPQLFFYPAVLITAAFGGFGPATLTVVLSCLSMAYWFLPPETGFGIGSPADALDVAIFGAMGITVGALMSGMRSATEKARTAWREAVDARARLDTAYRAREEMLAIVSHDLRSPLASIVLTCSQMQQNLRPDSDESVRISSERIRRATWRMDTLLRNLLDAATIEQGAFHIDRETVEVATLLEETVKLFEPMAKQKAIRLRAEIEETGSLRCDRARMLQALENLVGNAIKFVPKGGEVVMRARRDANDAVFEVHDSGPGIDRDQIDHIFDRYWKGGRGAGSGLGLYITKAIVEAHGGNIWATSNGGTTIAFGLPFEGVQPSEPRPSDTSPSRREAAPSRHGGALRS